MKKLTKSQFNILKHILKNKNIIQNKISIELGIPITTINNTIKTLEKIEIIKNENKHYVLIDSFLLLQYIT
ncbi:winged helix-turn-helix transcriptional regulator, partial [Candidatus Bathyarchaeota archaeon]|nr:winged helix-turn-helix transcriptional regulator [Candidatus Bathyarchaeota archaeon]